MSTAKRIQILARLIAHEVLSQDEAEVARINPTKPYKRRRLKMDAVSILRRRITKMQSRDPKLKRKRALYRKVYNRKNKNLLKRRSEFVRDAKKRLPPAPGTTTTPKRGTPAK